MSELLPVVVASFLGSLHCVGMCGGIVTFYSGSQPASCTHAGACGSTLETSWRVHAGYHGARLAAYAALGAAAGQLGAVFDGAGRPFGLGTLGSLLASATLLLWALPRALGARGRARLLQIGLGRMRPSKWTAAVQSRLVALALRAREMPPLGRALAMGLSSALLPCGWLYAFVVLAAGAGSAAAGALLLSAFWLGTVPALLGLALGVERLSRPLRAQLPRLGAVLVVLLASWNIIQRWPVELASASTSAAATPSCHAAR